MKGRCSARTEQNCAYLRTLGCRAGHGQGCCSRQGGCSEWGKGLGWQVAGEKSKDLVATVGEGEWACDKFQGPGEVHAVDLRGRRGLSSAPSACVQVIIGSGHCHAADQGTELAVEMSPSP